MNLESRKIRFVQEFLKLQSEDAISKLESILEIEKSTPNDKYSELMSQAEFDKRIDESELDFKNKRFKNSSEILAKYER